MITLDATAEEPLHLAVGPLELAAVEPITDGDRLQVQVTEGTTGRRDELLRRAARAARPSAAHEPALRA